MKKIIILFLLSILLCVNTGKTQNNQSVSYYHETDNEYQFMTTLAIKDASENSKLITSYLWIPQSCKKVRGVVILSQNVLEQWLAEHILFRAACAKSDLAILWSCPSFFVDGKKSYAERNVNNLQQMLTDLANISGYTEISRIPWLPIGHSGTNNLVRQLMNIKPARILAAITMKGGPGFGDNTAIPVMCSAGEYFEWTQSKEDLIHPIKSVPNYISVLKERKEKGDPLSYFFDPNTGHFDCSETLTKCVAEFIVAASKARLSDKNDTLLNPINLNSGWIAGLPLPGAEHIVPKPYKDAVGEERNCPWYFNKAAAVTAEHMASINWNRKTQIAGFAFPDGKTAGFTKGIVWPIPFNTNDDGVTFTLNTTLLKAIPDTFMFGGTKIGHGTASPKVILLCGNAKPVSGNTFRITPERSYKNSATYFLVKQEGDGEYRGSVEPGQLVIQSNDTGESQQLSFDSIPSFKISNKNIFLHAISSSGMPVSFFVKSGPVTIHCNQLSVNKIPPRTKFPIIVTIVAYQWGRSKSPAIKTAKQVERSFQIIR
jgi:hypothetical protein